MVTNQSTYTRSEQTDNVTEAKNPNSAPAAEERGGGGGGGGCSYLKTLAFKMLGCWYKRWPGLLFMGHGERQQTNLTEKKPDSF